ncbi:uncharacterized protein LOC127700739 [Mytilus californianus]|uniref:uncharacterized protein LOC127700739 n=1 Tax=Mytilus californianus TaxID=6549 RepID=UPI0022470363|nr:uncharacterized protein LOC127700739 [Mytilus californianus]XP_052060345.1 uncharacterized protein LOC127700739 [Mytilus californianus]
MTTRGAEERKRQKNNPIPKYSEPNQGNELTEDGNSSTNSQSPSKDRTRDKRGSWEGTVLQASEVFTLKVSLPAVVLIIALGMYVRNVENYYEHKFEVLMKYEDYLEKLETLTEEVPSLGDSLSELKKRLVPMDERAVDILKEIKTANDNLTNIEMRIGSISGISSKLEVDLPKQQEQFTEFTKKLNKTDIDISNFSKDIDSIIDNTTDIKKKLEMAFLNQTSLNGLLNKTTAKAEYVNSSVSKVHTIITEINKHLPTLENMNKTVNLIMGSYHLLPLLLRRLDENKDRAHGLELEVNETETRFKDIKEKSERVSETVSQAMEKQTDIEKKVKVSNDDITKLQQDMSKTDETVKNRLTKLTGDFDTSEVKFLDMTSKLDNKISTTDGRIGEMVDKVDRYSGKLEHFKSDVVSLSDDVKKMKPTLEYTGSKVQELDIQVRNLQSQNKGIFQPINVCVVLAFISIAVLFYLIYYRYDNGGTQFRENQRTESHSTPPFMSQRPPGILDRIHRLPVLDNKVCILSFYSETMNLHRKLVDSALATNRRGNSKEVIQHLVRKHEDILSIPNARYIFVFVDFNERNVILENPGQDLGDKKLVTVQAAQKIGADVFVTYVRDKGSNRLLPGNLYNQELSAFTSHDELKRLENKKRCFSVYETFNNTQKESIVHSIL